MGALLFFLLLIVLLGASTLVGLVLSRALERERPGRAMAIIALALFALATILAPLPRLYSIKRLLVTGWPFVILAVVYLPGGRFIWRRRAGIILVTLSLAATLLMITFVHKDDWRGAVNYINSHATSSDIVWLDPSAGRLPYEYYRPTITGMVSAEILPDPPAGTIWHIAERQPGKPVPSSSAESWLDEHGLLVLVEPTFNRLEVRQYEVARQE